NPTRPEGLFLATLYSNGDAANECYVAAYIYDITTVGPASYYGTAFTGDYPYPPRYNICRFARAGAEPPRYVIPCDSRYRWRFYAYKTINGTTYYSEWSKEMQYSSPDHLYDSDRLYLTRTSPPDPIPPYYFQE
ncbi:MAG: hypothetical protein ACP5PK_08000, partial [candidate division WOR-3 bacterium]